MRARFVLAALVLVGTMLIGRPSATPDAPEPSPVSALTDAAPVPALPTGPLPATARAYDGEYGFRFIRIRYDGVPYSRRATWAYDYPTAEQNLHLAIERTTGLPLDGPPLVLRLTDDRIFEHPILYLTEPGYWLTNDEEVENLQRYFARGGFMIIDDFHDYPGYERRQWDNFYHNIKQVFPDREPVELPPTHPIWSIYYDIDPVAAASTKEWFSNLDDQYYAIYDDAGRMVCVICYNQDIGDGWEWPNQNLGDASTVSFQMAINFILYALSHSRVPHACHASRQALNKKRRGATTRALRSFFSLNSDTEFANDISPEDTPSRVLE